MPRRGGALAPRVPETSWMLPRSLGGSRPSLAEHTDRPPGLLYTRPVPRRTLPRASVKVEAARRIIVGAGRARRADFPLAERSCAARDAAGGGRISAGWSPLCNKRVPCKPTPDLSAAAMIARRRAVGLPRWTGRPGRHHWTGGGFAPGSQPRTAPGCPLHSTPGVGAVTHGPAASTG